MDKIEKMNETNSCFMKSINKVDKPLARLIEEKNLFPI